MRLLAATIGALLISVSHPALTQENDGNLSQSAWQQDEPQQAEQQPAMPEPQAEQATMPQPPMPEAQAEQAVVQQPPMPEPQVEQAVVPQPAMPEPQIEQAVVQPPAMPEPQTEQAVVQPPAMPEPQSEQAVVQPPAMPEPQSEQAGVQPPVMPEPQPTQAEVQQPPMPEAQAEQAAMQPTMPEPQPAQVEIQPPAMPAPQAEQQAAIQQPATPEPVTQGLAPDITLPRDARWTVFVEPSLGTRMDLPSAVFATADGAAYRGVGRQFKTADGRAALAVYSQRNSQRDTPASYLRKNFAFPRTAVTYERITRDFFAVSGVRDDKIFYSRCNVSATGGTLHCFDLQFPATERPAWDAIVTRMSRSLRPLHRS